MSTPSGKPFDPFDLSPYAPKRARERAPFDRPSVENDGGDSSNGGDGSDDKSRNEAAALAYVPRAAMRPPAAGGSAPDLDAASQAQSRLRPDTSAAAPADKPATEPAAGDPDLARLESSLQWLQRESAATRLPRAVQLPPVSGLRPVNPDAPRPRSEQFINGIRVPPSLAPERLRPPPPMRERRDNLRGPLRILMASVIAAPIAYYFSVGSSGSPPQPAGQSALASFASRLVASAEFPFPKEKLRPGEAEAYNTVVSSRNKLVAQPDAAPAPSVTPALTVASAPSVTPALTVASAPSVTPAQTVASAPSATPVRVETVAALPPSPPPEPAAPASQPMRALDPESIKLLMQQGEQFVASGDLASARLVFRRAAEAGDAAAALAVGATYDPVVLAKIGVRGMGADVEKARSWYEKAKDFGSPDAPRRLEMLANR
jgi:hypothetical protein